MENLIYIIPVFGVLGLLYTLWKSSWISKQPMGTDKMIKIAGHIQEGAMAFLKAEYKVLIIFVVCVAILLALTANKEISSPMVAISFVMGAFCSCLAGFIGMKVATKANVRTTNAAREGLGKALNIAFAGGSVMGMGVVGLGVLGLGTLFIVYRNVFGVDTIDNLNKVITVLTGFSFGASSIALFARVGGGIYTKAADVGADLVGKVEAGIPEDHPLNPATIADNVGDNVGDVAGMGADLFESYVGSIIGSMVLGAAFMATGFNDQFNGLSAVLLPLVLAAAGIVMSIIGTFFVKVKEGGSPQKALNMGEFGSSILMIIISWFIIKWMLPETWIFHDVLYGVERVMTSTGIFIATIIGLVAGLLVGLVTEYYTGTGKKPVLSIVKQSVTGPATNIIAGLGTGMMSTAIPVLLIAFSIIGAFHFGGLYGIAIAAVGMLSNLGIQLAVDAYGPISDNSGGIAEMSGLPKEVRQRTDKLDAVGNTTAAIGKGFAIASAALTALALFGAFMLSANIKSIDISKANVIAGLFIGAMLPFVFSALAMGAVGRAAMAMIQEVRRQFTSIPALKSALEVMRKNGEKGMDKWSNEDRAIFEAADGKAEYGKCVEISTQAAIKQMVLPSLMAVAVPVIIAFLPGFGAEALGGLLAGVTVSGVLMAVFQSNAGGAWDNAKKMIEEGIEINGQQYRKGSDAHKAAVVGDTVGDPFKDTSGPSLNILLKLISIVALVLAPSIALDKDSANIEINTQTVSVNNLEEYKDVTNITSAEDLSKAIGFWEIDSYHSFVSFEITHLGFSKVKGNFASVNGTIDISKNISNSEIMVEIDVNSVNTGITNRDEHIRKPEFFEVKKFPKIIFQSNKIEETQAGYFAYGKLTVKNVTKEVILPFRLLGKGSSEHGDYSAFSGELTINRIDYNVGESSLEMGNDVNIKISVEAKSAEGKGV